MLRFDMEYSAGRARSNPRDGSCPSCEDDDMFKLTNVMEFHFIEMGKLIRAWKNNKLDPWNSVLVRWLLLLGMVDRRQKKVYKNIFKELEVIAMEDDSLRTAFQPWEELSATQKERHAYEARFKQMVDAEAGRRDTELWAKRKAEKEANEWAEKKARELANEKANKFSIVKRFGC